MRLSPSTKSRRRLILNVTSLIDVLFLLLIFFMVSSTFLENPGIKLNLPRVDQAPTTPAENLVVEIDAKANVYVDGIQVPKDSLLARLRGLVEGQNAALQLKADKIVPHGVVVQVMDISRQAGIKKLIIATQIE